MYTQNVHQITFNLETLLSLVDYIVLHLSFETYDSYTNTRHFTVVIVHSGGMIPNHELYRNIRSENSNIECERKI